MFDSDSSENAFNDIRKPLKKALCSIQVHLQYSVEAHIIIIRYGMCYDTLIHLSVETHNTIFIWVHITHIWV